MMTNRDLEERMAGGPVRDPDRPECGICWTDEEHASGYCVREDVVEDRAREEERVAAEEVGYRLASTKQRAFLIVLTFQKAGDPETLSAYRTLATSPTAPAAGVSRAIEDLLANEYRTDIFFGKIAYDEDGDSSIESLLARCVARELDRLAEKQEPDEDAISETEVVYASRPSATVPDGYYTVVLGGVAPGIDEEHRTLRVKTVKTGNLAGKTIVSYLAGSDNESDYVGFGFLDGPTLSLWKRFREDGELPLAVGILLDDPEAAGRGYALASGNCYVCGRRLTEPESIELGIGPICRGKR